METLTDIFKLCQFVNKGITCALLNDGSIVSIEKHLNPKEIAEFLEPEQISIILEKKVKYLLFGNRDSFTLDDYSTTLLLLQLVKNHCILPIDYINLHEKLNLQVIYSSKKFTNESWWDMENPASSGSQKKIAQLRYIGGDGKFVIVRGFNYYLNKNGKLTRQNRRTLLTKSKVYIDEILKQINVHLKTNIELPAYSIESYFTYFNPSISDLELTNRWNTVYNNWGYLVKRFEKKWNNENLINLSPSSIEKIKDIRIKPNISNLFRRQDDITSFV